MSPPIQFTGIFLSLPSQTQGVKAQLCYSLPTTNKSKMVDKISCRGLLSLLALVFIILSLGFRLKLRGKWRKWLQPNWMTCSHTQAEGHTESMFTPVTRADFSEWQFISCKKPSLTSTKSAQTSNTTTWASCWEHLMSTLSDRLIIQQVAHYLIGIFQW